jgi:hypothetical protein
MIDLPQLWRDAFGELPAIKRHYDRDGVFRFEQCSTRPVPRS